ncbi:hypothetical protein OH77DRAFT_1522729 [Trametes cingulata]|nr:hypothetical protein OH77DRAFT_1522729 [Trametes cingulata]
MRLLDTLTGLFVDISKPEYVRYAILSHTWSSAGEQPYHEILRLQKAARESLPQTSAVNLPEAGPPQGESLPTSASSENTPDAGLHSCLDRRSSPRPTPAIPSIFTHPELCPKIKGFCDIARRHGYRLVWMDSCCIDKTSSTELSEAINSMYEWYRLAHVCYVYLADVADGDGAYSIGRSRWVKRGWTLQELIAPRDVLFLTSSWSVLGSKVALVDILHSATGVDAAILTHSASLDSISVGRRLWWASRRETTRVEDEAYSLMGIFGIHMPTIYGEGRRAFTRLQQEILKTIPDQTLFVWGSRRLLDDSLRSCQPVERTPEPENAAWDRHGLLAGAPSAFARSADTFPISAEDFSRRLGGLPYASDLALPDYSFTAQGVRGQWPCIRLLAHPPSPLSRALSATDSAAPGALCPCVAESKITVIYVLLLRCQNKDGHMYALPLTQPPDAAASGLAVGTHHASCSADRLGNCRNIYFSQNALDAMRSYLSFGKELFIRQGLPKALAPSVGLPEIYMPPVLFMAIEPWCFDSLLSHGFRFSPVRHWASRSRFLNIPIDVLMTTTLVCDSGSVDPQDQSADEEPSGQRIVLAVQVRNGPAWLTGHAAPHAEVSVRHFFDGWVPALPPAVRPERYSAEYTPRLGGIESTRSGALPLAGFRVGFDLVQVPEGLCDPPGSYTVRTLTVMARPMYYEASLLPRLPYASVGALPPARYAALALTVELSAVHLRTRKGHAMGDSTLTAR